VVIAITLQDHSVAPFDGINRFKFKGSPGKSGVLSQRLPCVQTLNYELRLTSTRGTFGAQRSVFNVQRRRYLAFSLVSKASRLTKEFGHASSFNGRWLLSWRDGAIVARYEVPGTGPPKRPVP
jgi:hypothetical protein